MDENTQSGDGKNKVVDLGERRRKKSDEKDDGKAKLVAVFQMLSDVISGRESAFNMPAFPYRYFSCDPDGSGIRTLLVEKLHGSNVVAVVNEEALVNDILCYTRYSLTGFDAFQLTHRQASEAVRYWRGTSDPIPMPKPFLWPQEGGLTFQRLPWPPTVDKDGSATQTWNQLLSKMSNNQAFVAWIGSLFFERSDIHQYVWLFSVGGHGKGAINRFLARVFGHAYCSKQPPGMADRFWTYGLIGKRLVVFPDCNNHKFVTSGIFKSLTGGDPIDVEAKGKMGFTIKPNCKFLFMSNERPSISSEKADQRRVVYCEMTGESSWEAGFEDRLWEEGGAFLGTCIEYYRSLYPEHGPLAVDTEEIGDWVEITEGHYQDAFDTNFWISMDPDNKDHWVKGSGLQKFLLKVFHKDKSEVRNFIMWLERKHGIKRQTVKQVYATWKAYKGLMYKTEAPQEL